MSCFYPNIMYKMPDGTWKFGGSYRGSVHDLTEKIDGSRRFLDPDTGEVHDASLSDFVLVPCGRCRGCRIDRSRTWANRLMLEKTLYDDSECWFVTLTYDNEHIPLNEVGNATLVPDHLTKFMKSLRHATQPGVRFYAAGEYGEVTHRPHFHLILYGIPKDMMQLKPLGASNLGHKYYTSGLLDRCWKFGFHSVGEVTWETCAYTARYVVKKLTGDAAEFYKEMKIHPEFSRMSNRPGIGRGFYDEHKEQILDSDMVYLSTAKGGKSFRPPAYFDKLMKEEYPDQYERNKEKRSMYLDDKLDFQLSDSGLIYLEYLKNKEEKFKQSTNKLKRSLK